MCPHDQDQLWYEIYEFFNSFIQDFSTSVLNNSIKIILSVKIGILFVVSNLSRKRKNFNNNNVVLIGIFVNF